MLIFQPLKKKVFKELRIGIQVKTGLFSLLLSLFVLREKGFILAQRINVAWWGPTGSLGSTCGNQSMHQLLVLRHLQEAMREAGSLNARDS